MLRNRFVEEYLGARARPLAWPLQRAAAGDIYRASQAADDGDSHLLAGQGLRMLEEDGQGAAGIVEEVVAEAGAVLSRLAASYDPRELLDVSRSLDQIRLRNAIPSVSSTIRATTRTTANGIRMTSAALPVVV